MNDRSENSLVSPDRIGWRAVEWARMTGLKLPAIRSQIARGTLPTVKVGATRLIPRRVAVEAGLIDA